MNAIRTLTDRQRLCLDFIKVYILDHGFPPTLREIGSKMGIRSTNGVNDHLRALERKGYLSRGDMRARALRVVEPAVIENPEPTDSASLDTATADKSQAQVVLDGALEKLEELGEWMPRRLIAEYGAALKEIRSAIRGAVHGE